MKNELKPEILEMLSKIDGTMSEECSSDTPCESEEQEEDR